MLSLWLLLPAYHTLMVMNYIEIQNLHLVVQMFHVKLGVSVQKVSFLILTIKMLKMKTFKKEVTLRI